MLTFSVLVITFVLEADVFLMSMQDLVWPTEQDIQNSLWPMVPVLICVTPESNSYRLSRYKRGRMTGRMRKIMRHKTFPFEIIDIMPPLYFVLCRRSVNRYTKPAINLPLMVIKLQDYTNINTRTIQHYNSNAIQLLKCIILLKNHSFNIWKYGLSMYFSTSQKITLFFFTSLPLLAYLDFRVLKKKEKK